MRLPRFSDNDRRGIFLLECILFVVILLVVFFTSHREGRESSDDSDSTNTVSKKVSSVKTYTYAVPEEPVETFPFDPNTADSTTLLRLGLAPWLVQSIYRYRAKHGRYHTPEDFRRVRGMTEELWKRLEPCVRIDPKYQYLKEKPAVALVHEPSVVSTKNDTLQDTLPKAPRDTFFHQEKYKEGTLVDVNMADTSELKKIPGIASYRARKIVAYRTLLGGFVNVEQVMESCELPDETLAWFSIGSHETMRLDVNSLSVQRLMKHPYISFYQARALVEYRKAHGPLKDFEDLRKVEGFEGEKIEKLYPYLEFK